MINPDSLKNLKHNKSHWSTPETVVIRVPKYLRENTLDYAKKLDKGESISDNQSTVTVDKLKELLAKIERKEKGFKSNGAGQLIKELRELID